jgi:hypothetical protein
MYRGSSKRRRAAIEPGGLSDAKESALERLSEEAAREVPHLLAARAETATGLQDRRARLAGLHYDDDVSVVLMGSRGLRQLQGFERPGRSARSPGQGCPGIDEPNVYRREPRPRA